MRTIIDLPGEQLEALDTLCRRDRISRAEAIRRAVALLVGAERGASAAAAYGLWRDRAEDGLAYQQRMRDEWPADGRQAEAARPRKRR